MKRLETYLSDIVVLCKKHKVKSLYAFGSVLNEGLHPESDIDFIVGFLFIGSSSGVHIVRNFYVQLKNSPDLLAQATTVSLTAEVADAVLASLDELQKIKDPQKKEIAEAQAPTDTRDEAFDEIYEKYMQLLRYSKILEGDSQALEVLGIVVKQLYEEGATVALPVMQNDQYRKLNGK